MIWATRAGVHIDRVACAWLIRRYLDTAARFVFVEDVAEVPSGATAFDMPGVALGHHGGECSFETILRVYHLDDAVLWRLAQTVHEADLDDERFDVVEAAGLDVVVRALSLVCDDETMLALTGPVFDGLHEYYRRAILHGGEPV